MKRTIKFRVWSRTRNKYVENDCEFGPHYINQIWDCDDDFVFEQYTGFTDMNNREIYDGDIIFMIDGDVRANVLVIWTSLGWYVKTPNGNNALIWHDLYEHFEVIGNINENPHLLDDGCKSSD